MNIRELSQFIRIIRRFRQEAIGARETGQSVEASELEGAANEVLLAVAEVQTESEPTFPLEQLALATKIETKYGTAINQFTNAVYPPRNADKGRSKKKGAKNVSPSRTYKTI